MGTVSASAHSLVVANINNNPVTCDGSCNSRSTVEKVGLAVEIPTITTKQRPPAKRVRDRNESDFRELDNSHYVTGEGRVFQKVPCPISHMRGGGGRGKLVRMKKHNRVDGIGSGNDGKCKTTTSEAGSSTSGEDGHRKHSQAKCT